LVFNSTGTEPGAGMPSFLHLASATRIKYPVAFYGVLDYLILGMIIFLSISSSERNGDISSNGGEIRVPSGSRLAEDFGSKF